jgi:hypothetical protein
VVAAGFCHGIGFSRQKGFVDLKTGRVRDRAIDNDAITGAEQDLVAEHDLPGMQLRGSAVAQHTDGFLADKGQPVECPLGPEFLDDADAGVGDDDEAEQGVLRLAEDQDDGAKGADDRVEQREDVAAYDLGDRPACPPGHVVDLAASDPLRDLTAAQAESLGVRRQ